MRTKPLPQYNNHQSTLVNEALAPTYTHRARIYAATSVERQSPVYTTRISGSEKNENETTAVDDGCPQSLTQTHHSRSLVEITLSSTNAPQRHPTFDFKVYVHPFSV